ncbi:hypothetical protein F5Y01DRAFT_277606 [Xylaria sp. FL0043]|nr:hypothetical protein F5Y01DRAFT_277606 [Xylaria sp. FL0043]
MPFSHLIETKLSLVITSTLTHRSLFLIHLLSFLFSLVLLQNTWLVFHIFILAPPGSICSSNPSLAHIHYISQTCSSGRSSFLPLRLPPLFCLVTTLASKPITTITAMLSLMLMVTTATTATATSMLVITTTGTMPMLPMPPMPPTPMRRLATTT